MKIKKNVFSTLVLESFCQSKFSCKRLKIQKIQKSTPPTAEPEHHFLAQLGFCIWAAVRCSDLRRNLLDNVTNTGPDV
jgi:uncharacterized protein YbcC (UPF0753/DUF2309 family)